MKKAAGFLSSLLFASCVYALPGDLDTSFDGDGKLTTTIGSSDTVAYEVIQQSDGKLVTAGYGNPSQGTGTDFAVIRYNLDGSLDGSFSGSGKVTTALSTYTDIAYALVQQSDGKLVAAGTTRVNGNYDFALVRYNNDGSLDTSFGTGGIVVTAVGANTDRIRSIIQQSDGKLVVAGDTGTVSDFALARYNTDGSLDGNFGAGGLLVVSTSDQVGTAYSLIQQADGKLVVAGTGYEGNVSGSAFVLMRFNTDGSFDTSFSNDGKVFTNFPWYGGAHSVIQQSDGKLVASGYSWNGNNSDMTVVRYGADGSLDSEFGTQGIVTTTVISARNARAYDVVQQGDGKLVVAGYVGQNDTEAFALVRYNLNGALDGTFGNNGKITTDIDSREDFAYSLIQQKDGRLLAAGSSKRSSSGWPDAALARYESGQPDTDSDGTMDALDADDDNDGMPDVWEIAHGLNPLINDVKGQLDSSFNTGSGANTTVAAVRIQSDGKILIGGPFVTVRGQDRSGIARLNHDGSLDNSFNSIVLGSGFSGSGRDVLVITEQPDGKLLIGGLFRTVNGASRNRIARLNSDGTLDTTFNPGTGMNSEVRSIVVQPDGKILVGGYFSTVNDVARSAIVRLNSDGSQDTSFNVAMDPYGVGVWAMGLQADGKVIIGGPFNQIGGVSRNYIARLHSDGSIDTSFDPGAGLNARVDRLTLLPGNRLMIQGAFTTVNGVGRKYLARLNNSGTLDTSFVTPALGNGEISAFVVQPDGRVLIGGTFTTLNGATYNRLARLFADGSVDASFSAGAGPSSYPASMALQSDGKLVLGGYFATYNSVTVGYFARVETGINYELDTDGDGIGNNADTDDDNDGMPDTWETQYGLNSLDAADANGDPDGDGISNLQEYLNGTDPTISDATIKKASSDFDVDGDSDIFWRRADTGQSQVWVMQNGVRSLLNDLGYTATKWSYAGLGDFNGDGDQDVLLRDNATGEMLVQRIESGVQQSAASIGYNSAALTIQAVGDLDGDGDDDILLRNNSTSEFKGNFMQNHVSAGTSTLGYNKTSLAFKGLADVDGDGDKDIVQRDDATAEIKVQKLQAGVNTGPVSFGYNTTAHSFKAVLDADGDGDDDFLLRKDSDGSMIIVENEGGNKLKVNSLGYNSTALSFMAVGDFDGDGDQDILLRNSTSGELVTVMLQNATKASGGSIGYVATRFSFVGTGDFDGDGDDDLLFRDTATGENVRIAMQNGTIALQGQLNVNNVNLVPHLK